MERLIRIFCIFLYCLSSCTCFNIPCKMIKISSIEAKMLKRILERNEFIGGGNSKVYFGDNVDGKISIVAKAMSISLLHNAVYESVMANFLSNLESKFIQNFDKSIFFPLFYNCMFDKTRVYLTYEYVGPSFFFSHLNYVDLNFLNKLQVALLLAMPIHVIHAIGFVHCDVKPENYLHRPDNLLSIRLSDFGEVISVDSGWCVSGTPGYTPPEYSNRRSSFKYTEETKQSHDIYSLGIMLADLFSKRFLVSEASRVMSESLNMKVSHENIVTLIRDFSIESQKVPMTLVYKTITKDFFALVESMISFDPAKRPTISYIIRSLALMNSIIKRFGDKNFESYEISNEMTKTRRAFELLPIKEPADMFRSVKKMLEFGTLVI